MAREPQPIDFAEFASHLRQVFDRVRHGNTPVLVSEGGDVFRVELQEPKDIWQGYNPVKAEKALSASRGLFAGTSSEEFLEEIAQQREQGPNRFD